MATTTHSNNTLMSHEAQTPISGQRPLWQVPIFIMGVTALLVVGLIRPFCQDNPACRIDRDLAAVRQILSRNDGDYESALKLAEQALELSESLSERMGESAYLLGAVYIRLAEKGDPAQAKESWIHAKQYLSQAEGIGVPDTDQYPLIYRTGKVIYYLGERIDEVIRRLEASVEHCDSRVEGYQILQNAYLRLPKPDFTKAIEANRKLRSLGEINDTDLAAAKLFGGELLLRIGKPTEARESLSMIGDSTTPEIVVRARLLRAQSFMDEKQYSEASRLYNTSIADGKAPIPVQDLPQVYYQLGVCYRNLEQPVEATRAWRKCSEISKGMEAQAAQVLLGEISLSEPALENVVTALTQAVERMEPSKPWNNLFVTLEYVIGIFDRAVQVFRQNARHDLAMRLLQPFSRIAPPKKILELRAEIAGEWAKTLADNSRITPTSEQLQQSKDLFRQAAEACVELANAPKLKTSEKGEYVWRTAQNYLAGGYNDEALNHLKNLVTLKLEPIRLGEAYFRLGEVYRKTGRADEADKAYRKCMEYDSRFEYRARYQLAMALLEDKKVDEAEAALDLNIKRLRWVSDQEALAQSLFALGNLRYQQRHWSRVVPLLEHAVGLFKDNSETPKARYQLADSFRQLAAQETLNSLISENMSAEKRAHFIKEHRKWLQRAAEEFAELDKYLETPQGQTSLTLEQRTQIPFITAKCWYNLGQYEKALTIFEKLITRYEGKVEGLEALGGAVSCHAGMGELDKVKQRLLQIKTALPSLPEEVRTPWEEWLKDAIKLLNGT